MISASETLPSSSAEAERSGTATVHAERHTSTPKRILRQRSTSRSSSRFDDRSDLMRAAAIAALLALLAGCRGSRADKRDGSPAAIATEPMRVVDAGGPVVREEAR